MYKFQTTILIEDSILKAANMSEQELKVELAVMLYAQKRLSFGQARKVAGMGYFEFEKLLFDRSIGFILQNAYFCSQ